ncbi:MAG: hypothetical protein B7Y08_13790 [Rhodospirillales bacterium 24-66-33]|jgi:hypothetical protein|nr:MAG: hypothetical protein B7Y57_23555 [Rhodospirillales bacterium 35-66-84]OYZ94204.1 MAG: hypothetical protein B7Y08_13790 [Rhodospirillales bacterium 24-66-33]OZB23044.1 MAG: hypothetical protein B7X63_20935 [Rhodospirillales bacterium 39-66-50]
MASHPEVYTIGRISTEFFLRGFEVIGQVHDDILGGMILMTMLGEALGNAGAPAAIGIRELARRLDIPFETVRRQVHKLVRSRACRAEDGGICLAPSFRRSTRTNAMLRKIHLEAVRMLDGLRRIRIGHYKPPGSSATSRTLSKEQAVVVAASIRLLLAALKALRGFFKGDLMSGLVFTAIRAANTKHITNTAPGANKDLLPDADRRPVSMMAISNSMRLPYETVRRHAAKLIRQGMCRRAGRDGLVVPTATLRGMTFEAGTVVQLVFDFMQELRTSGMRV